MAFKAFASEISKIEAPFLVKASCLELPEEPKFPAELFEPGGEGGPLELLFLLPEAGLLLPEAGSSPNIPPPEPV